jgi:hypothetical protein
MQVSIATGYQGTIPTHFRWSLKDFGPPRSPGRLQKREFCRTGGCRPGPAGWVRRARRHDADRAGVDRSDDERTSHPAEATPTRTQTIELVASRPSIALVSSMSSRSRAKKLTGQLAMPRLRNVFSRCCRGVTAVASLSIPAASIAVVGTSSPALAASSLTCKKLVGNISSTVTVSKCSPLTKAEKNPCKSASGAAGSLARMGPTPAPTATLRPRSPSRRSRRPVRAAARRATRKRVPWTV